MTALRNSQMTVDEYIVWSEGRDGRWELFGGRLLKAEAERVAQLEVKFAATLALHAAVRRAKAPCEVLPSGATIRISQTTAYRPDALVRCGSRLSSEALETPDPIIVVEIVSPSSAGRDYGEKVDGYFSLPSLQYYLILEPEPRRIVHCRRGRGDVIERRLIASGDFRLDPPGMELEAADLFDIP